MRNKPPSQRRAAAELADAPRKVTLKTVKIDQLKPNPFRRLDEYPILRNKVDALKESIDQTGFWGTIRGRERGAYVEIAFGHHRMVALQEMPSIKNVQIIVGEFTNEEMLQMMACENMEEWGTSAWVEVETIRAVIDAYGKGEIDLPAVPVKTASNLIRYASPGSVKHPYTKAAVAEFLGWTKKATGGTLQPNYACEIAFQVIDAIDKGFLKQSTLKGLKRSQLADIVDQQWRIYNADIACADNNDKDAEVARKRAAAAPPDQRQRLEAQAKVYTRQAEQYRSGANAKAKSFGEEGADMFRQGAGTRDVRDRAIQRRSVVERPTKVHSMDDLAGRLAHKLERIDSRDYDDEIYKDFAFLKKNIGDLSPYAAQGLCESINALKARLDRRLRILKTAPTSHRDATRNDHEQKSLPGV
jgi:hypothetical protein